MPLVKVAATLALIEKEGTQVQLSKASIPFPWPAGNSLGKMPGHITWVKFADKYIFNGKIIYQVHPLLSEKNQHIFGAGAGISGMSVCV